MALKISVKAMATMPISVTCSGNVLRPNDVAIRRNGLRNHYRNHLLLYFLCFTLLILSGCASLLQKEKILAVVDGEPITDGELKYSLNIAHRKEDLSSAGTMNLSKYVQKLVDDRLIIDEARRSGMDQYPEVQQAIQAYIMRESVVRLYDEEIVKKVFVTEGEIRNYYKENYERFTLGLIEVKSEEEAGEISEQLKKGGNFRELAQEYSTHPSKKEGGEIVLTRNSLSTYIYEAVSRLKPDEFSDVIKTMNKFYIVKLIDRKEAHDDELDKVRGQIEKAIREQKEKVRSDEYLRYLREKATIKIDQKLLSEIKPGLTSEEIEKWSKDERPLASVNGTVLRVGDFVNMITPSTRKISKDILNSWIDRKIVDHEALSHHYENNPDLKKLVRHYENQLLKNTFIKRIIIPQIVITDEILKKYYLEHQESFINPVRFKIQQITVKTIDEAQEILNNLQNGADFSWLSKRRSTDSAESRGGDAGWFTKSELPESVREIIDTLKVGDISPIIKIDSLYRIVRLQDKPEEEVKEFKKVKDAVYRACFNEQINTLFNNYVTQLKTEAQIKIYDEEVRSLEERLQK